MSDTAPAPAPFTSEPKSLPKNIPGMPNGDTPAREWLRNFADQVASDPAAVGATPAQSERITALVAAFEQAFFIADCPCTRTKPNIRAKDQARSEAVVAVRELVNAIKANPQITEVQKICLGFPTESQKKRQAAARDRRREDRESRERAMSRSGQGYG